MNIFTERLFYCVGGLLVIVKYISSYENVALNKMAWQQHPYSTSRWGADKAVDGQFTDRSAVGGQCTISANNQLTATWRVDLGRILSIHHISIYHQTDNVKWDSSNGYTARFLGFSVYISNTTNKDEGIRCFKDSIYTRDTIPDNVTIECVTHGRYVIYYNERLPGVTYPSGYSSTAFNALCEVQVYGCSFSNVYGNNCDIPCPQNCQGFHCNIEDGTCHGCVAGFKGPLCEEQCGGWKYGQNCNQSCGSCLNFEQCHHINGTCFKGCDRGIQGEKCTEACPEGRYGYNCQDNCSIHCGVPGRCNRVTGECQSGCQAGWNRSRCDKICDGGTFGLNCNQSCGICLDKEQCHHINGSCLNGCDRGYQGISCTQECAEGRHGYNCQETCSTTCVDPKRCDSITGQCSVKKYSSVCKASRRCYPSLYGVISILCLSVALNIFFVIWFYKNRAYNRQHPVTKNTNQLSTEYAMPNTEFYEKVEENVEYQKQGQMSLSTDNKTSKTQIYDNVEDNTGYQELGQLSQPSLYDKLH